MKLFEVKYDKHSPYVDTKSYYQTKSLNDVIRYHEDLYGMCYVQSINEVTF